jgi:hypothetical protein
VAAFAIAGKVLFKRRFPPSRKRSGADLQHFRLIALGRILSMRD